MQYKNTLFSTRGVYMVKLGNKTSAVFVQLLILSLVVCLSKELKQIDVQK